MEDTIINVRKLSKRYGLPLPGILRYAQKLMRFFQKGHSGVSQSDEWALKDISFEARRGEFIGVIGRNGAGKSTLLKILAGVTPPTEGQVEMRGRIFPMIELNAGLHKELTGRENVRLLGVIMGFSANEIETRMSDIKAFTELDEWFDEPVRKYSSGMLARLGFGVAMNVDADILLIDEVLAVGDLAFQRRCFDKLGELRASGVTTIFVSHALRQVERLCDRTIFMVDGKIEQVGHTAEVVHKYYTGVTAASFDYAAGALPETVKSSGEVSLVTVDILDDACKPVEQVEMGQPITIKVVYNAIEALQQPNMAIGILTADFLEITNFSTDNEEARPDWRGQGVVYCKIPNSRLLPGTYYLKIFIRRNDGFKCLQAQRIKMFQVVPKDYNILRNNLGFFHTEVSWDFEANA